MTDFLRIWIWLAVGLVCLQSYLIINKLWIRRHQQVVAESVSVVAQLLAIAIGVPFIADYMMSGDVEGTITRLLYIVVNVVLVAIGLGLWVEGNRDESLLTNLRRALRLERKEASSLLKDFIRPVGANQVLGILHGLALIDRELGSKERELIDSFAEHWQIDMDQVVAEADASGEGDRSFALLRQRVEQYLRLSPPVEQAQHLSDVMTSLVQIDDVVTEEEELILAELRGLLDDYSGASDQPVFRVFIAPQSHKQQNALSELLPDLPREQHLGGEVFVVGDYYSDSYAELVCGWYREMGFLTFRNGEHRAPDEAAVAGA